MPTEPLQTATSPAEQPAKWEETPCWGATLLEKRRICEGRLLPVMEQMDPKIMYVMQQMTRHQESADLLEIITSDPDLSLAQAVHVLLNAAALHTQKENL